MNKLFKSCFTRILEWQVYRLKKRHTFKIVGIVGSIGKTSTKAAIARVLSEKYRIRFQNGNYNEPLSVPLVFFGHTIPSKKELLKWVFVFLSNEYQIFTKYPFDIVVLELGTDGPGQIASFGSYLKLDIGVVTAIAPEHMEFFKNIEEVAHEELSVSKFSKQLLINKDLCHDRYLREIYTPTAYYARLQTATFQITNHSQHEDGYVFDIFKNGLLLMHAKYQAISDVQLYTACAAAAVGNMLGIETANLQKALESNVPVSGRMQTLRGINQSIIIDDTYNASPEAVVAALNTLYTTLAPYKIAILGMMNELGTSSESEHRKIGQYCDPSKVNLVVTIGDHANRFIAEEALKKKCIVYKAKNAQDAGLYLKNKIKDGSLILAKGSQNNVFAEETIKILLANPEDSSKLVRQDEEWMEKKKKLFA